MKATIHFLAILLALAAHRACADAVKDREGAVRGDKAAMEKDARWIYNDLEKGRAEAKMSGKPLLVVLRCVPCVSCAGIDAGVLTDPSLSGVLDKFVCVRLINANALDLAAFQFDYDLSFSTLFFHADGTIYGRYGSWTHQKNPQDKTTAGFKATLEAVLALHAAYPSNKQSLSGKTGGALPFQTPVEIPSLAGKYQRELNWEGKVVQSCVHCHMIGDAFRSFYREKGQAIPDEWIYPQPSPEALGITLAADSAARVEQVAADSAAARAGMKPGDELSALGGQPVVSAADVSWVLHRTGTEAASLAATVRRGGQQRTITLSLPEGWRSKSATAGRASAWSMRGMATGGLVLEDLSDSARTEKGIAQDALALSVKFVGQYGKHAAGKNAGFQQGDVIVSLAGSAARMSESEMIGHLLRRHKAGETVKASVLRGEKRLELSLPMQ